MERKVEVLPVQLGVQCPIAAESATYEPIFLFMDGFVFQVHLCADAFLVFFSACTHLFVFGRTPAKSMHKNVR